MPNLRYAEGAPHPTDIVTGYDATFSGNAEGLIYMDQSFAVGPNATSNYAKSIEGLAYQREYAKRGIAGDGGGQMYGWATCHWVRHCDRIDEILGSPCNATLSNVLYSGYCFASDTGSLECGHLTAIDDKWGENPVAFDAQVPGFTDIGSGFASPTRTANGETVDDRGRLPSQEGVVREGLRATLTVLPSAPGEGPVYRCPSGSPARSLGSFVSKRLKIAGCMIPSDPSYDQLAEVHVPGYCTVQADFHPGCLLPAALNYDPIAKQDAVCHYHTKGCRSSTAINYHPEATIDDPDHPCIEIVRGCTVNSRAYSGVNADTPGFRSDYYGSAQVGVGVISERVYEGPAVLNFDNLANVYTGCVIGIEGCMDSTAVNYDSRATTNSGTWCIPRVSGCMLPTDSRANDAYVNPEVVSNAFHIRDEQPDGLNANFSLSATVHNPSHCVIARYGCGAGGVARAYLGHTQPITATNYDPTVTVETVCFWPRTGCLNPFAMNFGCENSDSVNPCFLTVNVTVHAPAACVYIWDVRPNPPAPAMPSFPPGIDPNMGGVLLTYVVTTRITVAATLDYFTEPVKQSAITAFKAAINQPDADVTLIVSAGSVNLEYRFETNDQTASDSFEESVRTGLGTTAGSAQAAFGNALNLRVLSKPDIATATEVVYIMDTIVAEQNRNRAIQTTLWSIFGTLLLVGLIVTLRRFRRRLLLMPPMPPFDLDASFVGISIAYFKRWCLLLGWGRLPTIEEWEAAVAASRYPAVGAETPPEETRWQKRALQRQGYRPSTPTGAPPPEPEPEPGLPMARHIIQKFVDASNPRDFFDSIDEDKSGRVTADELWRAVGKDQDGNFILDEEMALELIHEINTEYKSKLPPARWRKDHKNTELSYEVFCQVFPKKAGLKLVSQLTTMFAADTVAQRKRTEVKEDTPPAPVDMMAQLAGMMGTAPASGTGGGVRLPPIETPEPEPKDLMSQLSGMMGSSSKVHPE